MSLVSTIGKVLGMVIFSITLSAAVFSMGLSNLTDYENSKAIFSEILSPQLKQSFGEQGANVEKIYSTILERCEGKDSIDVPITEGGNTVLIDCNQVRAIENQEGEEFERLVTELAVSAIFQDIYYRDYDCEFLKCIGDGEVGIIMSPKGHQFFLGIQNYLYVSTLVGLAIIFVSAESWMSRAKCVGASLASFGFVYLLLVYAGDWLSSSISPEMQTGVTEAGINLSPIMDSIFQPIMDNLLILSVSGIAITVISYGWELYRNRKELATRKKTITKQE